jgi:hypothetical protein
MPESIDDFSSSANKGRQTPELQDCSVQGAQKIAHLSKRIVRAEADAHRSTRQFRRHAHRQQHMRGLGLALEQAAPAATAKPARSSLPTRVSPSTPSKAK